jgi:metal-responsive CopG/Arc/MetJ family transcriptional regulator
MAKVMISITDELLARVDAEAKRRKTTRSGLVATAVDRELSRPDRKQMEEAFERLERSFRDVGPLDAEALIRAERDSH